MKRTLLALALLTAASFAMAASWTYRGTLNDGGKPANGNYDLRLTLIDAKGSASRSAPITLFNVPVKEGNFSAEVDFGVDLSRAPAMQLKTEVAQGNSGFVSLGAPTNFDPKAALAGICWDTTGNVVAAGEFLGASNDVGVEIKANNLRAARFKAAGTAAAWGDAPQVVLGSAANSASNVGATVGGGATRDSTGQVSARENTAGNRFATVAGGLSNTASGAVSVISGGEANVASGTYAVVGGGNVNRAVGANSVVSGGFFNCAGGDNSWAGGFGAVVRQPSGAGNCTPISGFNGGDSGTFVWADSQVNGGFFTSTGQNQFLVRAEGGVAINTNMPAAGAALTVNGNIAIPNPGSVAFGATTRQMLNMFNADYGIGVQAARMYFRVAPTGGFNWFEGGVHSDVVDNAGAGGTRRMTLSSAGQLTTTTGTISTISDGRLKTGVSDYTGALAQIAQLRPVHYRYINAGKADFQPMGEHLGFIAQEVQNVFPQWVNTDDSGYLSLSMRGFEAVAVRAMQELQAENKAKTSEIAALKARLDALEAKLTR
jgi:trimeric autotransporter adhesin